MFDGEAEGQKTEKEREPTYSLSSAHHALCAALVTAPTVICRNIFDWLCYILLLVDICTHVADVLSHSEVLARAHIRLMAITIILLWLRLMKNARAFALLGKISGAFSDFTSLIALFRGFKAQGPANDSKIFLSRVTHLIKTPSA